MDGIFNNLNTEEGVATAKVEGTATPKNTEKSEKIKRMKEAFRATATEDPTFKEKIGSKSEFIEMVNTYGWGDTGNIVVDKAAKAANKDDRNLVTTSAIVGYCIRNNGKEPMNYKTEVWAKGEDGKFYPNDVEKVLAPGETCQLTRQYMTMFCSQPEISFQLSNGKIIRGSGGSKSESDLKAELEAHYFTFNKNEGKNVNHDETKIAIGAKSKEGKWTVKPEFEETFGFLNNPREGRSPKSARDTEKYTSQDLAAAYINKLIRDTNGTM